MIISKAQLALGYDYWRVDPKEVTELGTLLMVNKHIDWSTSDAPLYDLMDKPNGLIFHKGTKAYNHMWDTFSDKLLLSDPTKIYMCASETDADTLFQRLQERVVLF